MALHLDLTVRLFSDRYHGREWPPSPARVFKLLLQAPKPVLERTTQVSPTAKLLNGWRG